MQRRLQHASADSKWIGLAIVGLAFAANALLPGMSVNGDEPATFKQKLESVKVTLSVEAEGEPANTVDWPEGATVKGQVLDPRGKPIANAEVLMLGQERVIVDADRRNWFVPERNMPAPASARTDKNGFFTITRKQGAADRLAVIAEDPLLWVVSRKSLKEVDHVEIKLPQAGSLAIQSDLPGKPAKLPVMIELKSFDNAVRNMDSLRYHPGTYSLANPGETVFEHLPPGQYAVQRQHETKTDGNSILMSGADRQLVTIESAKRTSIRFERKIGQPLAGQVKGLENAELRYAYLTITHWGPEEVFGKAGKRSRMMVTFDVVPITSDGRFTTDPIPPGEYSASLFAVLATTPRLSSQTSDFTGESSFSVPEKGDLPQVEIVAEARPPRDLSKVTDLRLRVVDEEGKPVAEFQAMVRTADGNGLWISGGSGIVFLGAADKYRDTPLDVLVRAEGFSSRVERFVGEKAELLSKGEAAVTLRRGLKIQLRFNLPDAMTWPNGTLPEAYFDNLQAIVRGMRQPMNRRKDVVSDFNMLNLREAGEGRFECRLADDTPPFHVAIHAPGFLQNFETGPFTLADMKDGCLEIDVPRPARLDVSFEPGDHASSDPLFESASLEVWWKHQGNSMLQVISTTNSTLSPRLKMTDLAPGNYWVNVRTQPKKGVEQLPETSINPGVYSDRKTLSLKSGGSESIEFRSTPYDPDAFRGTRTAVVRIRTPDGGLAKDCKATISYYDGHYGSQTVFSGAIPQSGEIVLADITDRTLSRNANRAYTVILGAKRLGTFGFTAESTKQEFEFVLAPDVGDPAPDVELTSLATGESIRLSSFRGKVVFLEFWATWCGPCQQPMTKLNALWGEQSGAWNDRVVIVPVGIDSEHARIKSHVERRGWNKLSFYCSGSGEREDFDAPAARLFVVSGVPDSLLIGPDGRILWRGHPMESSDGQDLKSRIVNALK